MSDRLGMFSLACVLSIVQATPILLIFLGTNSLASVLETPLFHRLLLLPVLIHGDISGVLCLGKPAGEAQSGTTAAWLFSGRYRPVFSWPN